MDLDQTLEVAAGIGCRAGVTTAQVEAAIAAALAAASTQAAVLARAAGRAEPATPRKLTLSLIATPAAKTNEPAIAAAAVARGVPLALISQSALEAANRKTLTHSNHSMSAMNVHSVAEAAALAGAGTHSQLLGPRIVVGPVTCALATAGSEGARSV
jgi:cobalt-precorrin 5A hydrolase